MRKVFLFSSLLVVGLILSQFLPAILGSAESSVRHGIVLLTMVALSFIMIHVGYEFDIDKSRLGQYGWDYVVAMTAAAFPWIFAAMYFVFVMTESSEWGRFQTWKEALLAGRFAAPTSAGVLFSMLIAGGLAGTWVFRKVRILAIFDDLDTVLLMIPLKMMMIGLAWQLGVVVIVLGALLAVAYIWLHRWRIPVTWPWVLGYALIITALSEAIYLASRAIQEDVGIHIEVLLPAFVLGCLMARPAGHGQGGSQSTAIHSPHEDVLERPVEKKVATIVSAIFMVLVGLNMPAVLGASAAVEPKEAGKAVAGVLAAQSHPGWGWMAWHVLVVTFLANLGKMYPALCYRREASWRERLAVAVSLWPRGEVGAGVLIVSLSYGIGGPAITVAMLSLALNLALTGLFILLVQALLRGTSEAKA